MKAQEAFVALPALQVTRRSHRIIGPCCSVAPAKPASADENVPVTKRKKSQPVYYRVLPDDLPAGELPATPPVHFSVPIVGFAIEAWFNSLSNVKRMKKYGSVYVSNMLLRRQVYVTHYGAVAEILRDAHIFRSSGAFPSVEAIFGSDTPLTLDGKEHSLDRGIIASGFTPNLFGLYFDKVHSRFRSLLDRIESEVATNGKVNLDPLIREAYLSAVIEATTSIDMDGEKAHFIREKFSLIQAAIFSPPFGPVWDKMVNSRASLYAFLSDVVCTALVEQAEAIEKLRQYGDRLANMGGRDIAKGDVNELLIIIARSELQTGPGQTYDPNLLESICRKLMSVWFGGYGTPASTTNCGVFELGWNSEIWDRLTAEQDALVAANGGNRDVTYEQLSRMPLLEAFLFEIMRLHPAIPGLNRIPNKDVEILGKLVRAGEPVYSDLSAAMKNEEFYSDPLKLDLERFLKKEGLPSPPRILTFGVPGSPHYCLGALFSLVLMKTVFGLLLREYTMELDPNQSRKYGVVPDDSPLSKIIVQKFERR